MANVIASEKLTLLIALLNAGESVRAIMRCVGVAKHTVTRYRKLNPPACTCKCGGPLAHHGWCTYRFSQSSARQAFIREWTKPRLPSWQRPTMIWLGQWFNPLIAADVTKITPCAVRGCIFPVLNGVGKYCYQHNHWFDFPITMHDRSFDPERLYNRAFPYQGYDLAAEFPTKTANLEKSLKVEIGRPHKRGEIFMPESTAHKNAGDSSTMGKPVNYSQSPGSGRRRIGHGKKKIRLSQRRRGANWHGKRDAHDAEKRWTREELEIEANFLLGEEPIEIACNFIPPDDRDESGEEYEYTASK